MKRIIGMLIAIMFACTTSAFASEPLTDAELDSIDAGNWIVVEQPEGWKEVHEVYKNSNSFLIEDEAQKDIQAVANTNVVDSAVAVQTNISSATGNAIENDIKGHNEANIINYNPSESSATWDNSKVATHVNYNKSDQASEMSRQFDTWSTWDTFSSSKDYDYDETLDINFAAAAAGSSQSSSHYDKKGGHTPTRYNRFKEPSPGYGKTPHSSHGAKNEGGAVAAAAVFTLDYDKTIDAEESAAGSWHTEGVWDASSSAQRSLTESNDVWVEESRESGSESRSNLAEWNGLLLVETAQTNLQVVSNLNSVGSGAAVQSNIASNVGVGGKIYHSSSATVINGL